MSRETDPGYTTFEVTLPNSVNEQTLALHGLGSAFGWNIKQRTSLTSDLLRGEYSKCMEVTQEDLKSVSTELWGTEVYGENAVQFLDEERRNFLKNHSIYTYLVKHEGYVIANSELAYVYGSKVDHNSSLGTYSKQLKSNPKVGSREQHKLEEFVAELWPLTSLPFEVPKVIPGEAPRWTLEAEKKKFEWWVAVLGPISRVRLAHYSRISGIAKHALQGSVGKTHDVINVTAGLTSKEDVVAKQNDTADLDFVDYDKFRATLKGSELAPSAQNEICKVINWSLSEQILRGMTRSWLTDMLVVVEGPGGWVTRGGQRLPHFEKIARQSLAHLLDSQPKTKNVAPRKFLTQFA